MGLLLRRETANRGRLTWTNRVKIADELKKMDYEPLLPVEKRLIAWSIGLGIVLLGILIWVSYTFFPG